MKEIFEVFKNKKCLIRMLISGLLFLVIAAPFRALLSLVPGVTEVRPANMIPPVLGLIWGPAAAWGITIANAISDILVSHSGFSVWFPGMIINFFFAYLPYKLWYSFSSKRGDTLRPNLNSVSEILRFIYVCFIDSLVTTVLLALLFEILGFQSFTSSVLLLFFNNFDFTIVLGIPVILILSNSKRVQLWIPEECQKSCPLDKETLRKKQFGFDIFLYLIGAAGIFYYFAARFAGFSLSKTAALIILVLFICMEILYIVKPCSPLSKRKDLMEIRNLSIRAKVIIGFLMLSIFFVLIIGTVTFFSQRNVVTSDKDLWQYIYTVVGISLNIIFIISLLFLKYVEINITNPLELLSQLVKQFAARDHQSADMNETKEFLATSQSIHTGDEIEALSGSFHKMMLDIDNYVVNLASMTAEKERIGAELNVATQIQADMLPRIFPAFPERKEFNIFASMDPAKEVGGDFYDFFLVDDDHLAIVIADVSGKGVPAALFMVIAKTLIKNHALIGECPADIFTNVNDQLCEGNEAGLFVTGWMGILNLTSGDFVYVNAGHNPPLLMRKGGEFSYLKNRPGFVLAGMEGMRYKQAQLTLAPGDRIYLYTDGVTEATDIHNELYG
ncbi:MAG: SpoIIE family protein phosphatase [Blautia sp.]|jgi:sigma-B regulation protein RsbU (phosphoserine phosphatase)